jgi:hypothetical protein
MPLSSSSARALHTDIGHMLADHYRRVIRLTETGVVVQQEVPDQMRHPFLREQSSKLDRMFMVDFHRDSFEVPSFTGAIAFFAEGRRERHMDSQLLQ